MEVRHLRYFLQAFQDGSILRAAEHISISQQALSKAIASFEQEIGGPLFIRTNKGLLPTEMGEALREQAQSVVDAMNALQEEISVYSKLHNTRFSFGISQGVEHFVRQSDLDDFYAKNPSVHIDFTEHSFDVCETLVGNGSMTAALISGPVHNTRLVTINLFRSQRIALMRRENPLAQKNLIHISDFNLKEQRLVMNINNRCLKRFCKLCRSHGFEPIIHRVGDTSTVFDLCNGQNYVGVSIDFLMHRFQRSYPDVVARPIDFNEISYPIDLIVTPSQYNRTIVRHLIDHICQSVMAIHNEDMKNHIGLLGDH